MQRHQTQFNCFQNNLQLVILLSENIIENMARGKKSKKKDLRKHKDIGLGEDMSEDLMSGSQVVIEPVEKIFKGDELIELQTIFEKKDLSDVPPLVAAATLGKFDVVKKLLKEGHSVNCLSHDNSTPLMSAARRKNLEMIDMLVRRGADVNLQNDEGDTAMLIALQNPAWDEDAMLDFWNVVKGSENLNIDQANKLGYTMLHYVTKNQWKTMVSSLLESGSSVNCITKKGVTPLMMAASRNHSAVVAELLRAGPDISLEDERGCTALCYSITYTLQKKLEPSNPTLQGLLSALHATSSKFTMEDYLKRRLDILLKPPPEISKFVDVVTNIIIGAIRFCIRNTKTALKILLDQHVFRKIAEATDAHLDDAAYTQALLRIMLDILRYCPCCFGGGKCTITVGEVMNAFTSDGAADVCLSVIRQHSKTQANKLVVVAALTALCTSCSTEGMPRIWLQAHYKELLTYHQRYLSACTTHFSINTDEHLSKILHRRMKRYRNLISRLEKGEGILEKTKEKLGDIIASSAAVKKISSSLLSTKCTKTSPEKESVTKSTSKTGLDSLCINCTVEYSVKQSADINGLQLGICAESESIETSPSESTASVIIIDSGQSTDNSNTTKYSEETLSDALPRKCERSKMTVCLDHQTRSLVTSSMLHEEHTSERFEEKEAVAEQNIIRDKKEDITIGESNKLDGLRALFESISTKYIRLWEYERKEDYPGHLAGGDGVRILNRDDDNLSKLKAFLPRLEEKHIMNLTRHWESLYEKITLTKNKQSLHRTASAVQLLLEKHANSMERNVQRSNGFVETLCY